MKFFLIIFCTALWVIIPLKAQAEVEKIEGIEVRGSSSFVARVKEVLAVLGTTPHLTLIQKYLKVIEEGDRTETDVFISTCYLRMETLMESDSYSASAIAHEAYHSKLYHDAADEWKKKQSQPESSVDEEREELRQEFKSTDEMKSQQAELRNEIERSGTGSSEDDRETAAVLQKIKDIEKNQDQIKQAEDGTALWRALELERRRLKVGLAEKHRNSPEFVWMGVEGERKCLLYERQVLQDLGGDQRDIDWVNKNIENPTYQGDPHSEEDAKRRWW